MTNKIETGLLLDYYGGMLTARQQEILHFYCDMDMSLSEISEELGITRQAALDLITRGTDRLKMYEEKLGLIKKIKNVRTVLQSMIDSTQDEITKTKLLDLLSEIKEI